MASQPLTPFQKKMCAAAEDLLKTTPLTGLGWRPDGPVGMSHSERNKVFIVHVKGPSELGLLTAHVWFDDVNEKEGTFKVRQQVMFAGRSGKPNGEDDDCAQIFWGGSLGFRYPL